MLIKHGLVKFRPPYNETQALVNMHGQMAVEFYKSQQADRHWAHLFNYQYHLYNLGFDITRLDMSPRALRKKLESRDGMRTLAQCMVEARF